jgi:hypothetical protein
MASFFGLLSLTTFFLVFYSILVNLIC